MTTEDEMVGWHHQLNAQESEQTQGNRGLPVAPVVKNRPANPRDTGDSGLIPGSGRSPGVGNGNPLQYSPLENPTDRGG